MFVTGSIKSKDTEARLPFVSMGEFPTKKDFINALSIALRDPARVAYDYRTIKFHDNVELSIGSNEQAHIITLDYLYDDLLFKFTGTL